MMKTKVRLDSDDDENIMVIFERFDSDPILLFKFENIETEESYQCYLNLDDLKKAIEKLAL